MYTQAEYVAEYALGLLSDAKGLWALAQVGREAWETQVRLKSNFDIELLARSFLRELKGSREEFFSSLRTKNPPADLQGEWTWVGLEEKVGNSWKSKDGHTVVLKKRVRVPQKRAPECATESPGIAKKC